MARSAVFQIITCDGRYHHVPKAQSVNGLADARRFVDVQRLRSGGGHGAEAASPRAAIARDHESGCATAPALPMIRAPGAFANGVQVQFLEQRARVGKVVSLREANPEP